MKSVMKHNFSQVPAVTIPRSHFDRSCGLKTTFDSGYLVPILVDEVLPGDTFNLRASAFARLSTPLFPYMDNAFLDTQFFFVPTRLVWDNFQKQMGEQIDPGDSTDYLTPKLEDAGNPPTFTELSIFDYAGLPINVALDNINALPFRAMNLIYNTWYRDENLQNSLTVNRDDGPDDISDYALFRRNKRHDYFTSCLPWPQKGVAVDLPLGTSAPITGLGMETTTAYTSAGQAVFQTDGTGGTVYANAAPPAVFNNQLWIEEDPNNAGFPNIRADLSAATAATINQLRVAYQLQTLYERDARGGTRYIELIKSHFGVTSPDARLQRPEYLGGGSTPVNVHPVASTTDVQAGSPTALGIGGLRGFATAAFNGHGFTKSFVEHGYVIGFASVRADLTYQQGLNKMWSRRERFDMYWPALAQIGEQAVLNKEIYADGSATDDQIFGYQERFAEYRYKPSQITGRFRSQAAASLDAWHLAQDYATLPVLGDAWIQENPPFDRVVQVTSEPQFIADFYFNFHCARPMPLYGVPASLTRF